MEKLKTRLPLFIIFILSLITAESVANGESFHIAENISRQEQNKGQITVNNTVKVECSVAVKLKLLNPLKQTIE